MAADGQPVFLIEQGGLERAVTLQGSDLPTQGVEEVANLRIVKTLYPGATSASMQVMGTDDGEFPVSGRFSDQLTGRVGGALEKRAELRALQKGMRFIELRWGDVFSKVGLIRELRFSLDREAEISYSFVFDVAEASDAEVIASTPAPASTEVDALNLFRDTGQIIDEARAFLDRYEAYDAFRLGLRASVVI